MVVPTGWVELISRPEHEIPLDEGALLIAAAGDPTVDVAAELAHLDQLAERVEGADCESVCRLLFETLGIEGDRQTYDDPQNSYLHRVIARRRGIPITLSVLLMETGRRCGVPLEGVGMPGHFLVREPSRPDLLIDAFSGGQRLDEDDCARLMRSVVGPSFPFDPTMLSSIGSRSILARMLANLEVNFRRRQDPDGRRWVARLQVAVPGIPLGGRVSLADTLAEVGCYEEARVLLDEMANDPDATPETAAALRARARRLLSPLN